MILVKTKRVSNNTILRKAILVYDYELLKRNIKFN